MRQTDLDRADVMALVQALYYIPTGLWAVLHLPSFERVTGPKVDRWLVKSVGALVGVEGVALAMAGLRRRTSPELAVVAVGSAMSLAVVDVVYVSRRRISAIYLLDALGEVLLIGGWLAALRARR